MMATSKPVPDITGNDILALTNGTHEQCSAVLDNFVRSNEKCKTFPNLTLETIKSIYNGIFGHLTNPSTPPPLIHKCLSCLRILSREVSSLEYSLTDDHIQTILKVSKLKQNGEYENCGDTETLEALKVVFNMIFQSSQIRYKFISNGFLNCLVSSAENFTTVEGCWEIKYFIMRNLFIITALVNSTVPTIRNELNGLTVIMDYLQLLALKPEPFDDGTAEVICEMLKVVYNLIHDLVPTRDGCDEDVSEKDMGHLTAATKLVKVLLFHDLRTPGKKDELQSHSIDLLAVIPFECFSELVPPTEVAAFTYDGYDMSVVEEMVQFLNMRLDAKPTDRKSTLVETVSPVLCVLVRMAGKVRPIRKYLKLRVLPPLKKTDVLERPEVGGTLRNKLCALMTSAAGPVTELACNFLFILVKENVKRLVKYTGFGNAAGLLANRGLLGGGKSATSGVYSSESEDSDTSEYKEVSHLINGFGWIEPERPPPCEGMTDEQKEYEAMKLVDAIDKLNRNQLIQPVQIGPDGRPHPIENICQLLDHSTLGADSLIHSNHNRHSDSSDSE